MLPSETKKQQNSIFFVVLCCLIYFASYLTRKNYASVLVEIIDDLNIPETLAGMADTGSFITYGVGQLISGVLGDRIPPRRMIAVGLGATSVINLLIPLMPNVYCMSALWWVNGFCQAMLWPPLVRIMSENMDSEFYAKASVFVSAAASAATIFIRAFLAPVTIELGGWKPIFIIGGTAGLTIVIIWWFGTRRLAGSTSAVPAAADRNDDTPKVSMKVFIASGAVIAMVGIILQGILRDGIEDWMPSYMKNIFAIDNSDAILSSSLLPIFGIFSTTIAAVIQSKIRNELKTSTLLFSAAALATIVILLVPNSMILTIVMMALITGCMHGINLMLISRLPVAFKKYGKVSTVSGILNACTYIGSALAACGLPLISSLFGWEKIIIVCTIIAIFGTVVCAVCIRKWAKFTKQ